MKYYFAGHSITIIIDTYKILIGEFFISKNLLPSTHKLIYCNTVKFDVIQNYGDDVMENAQLSGGAMLVLGIIIAIVIVLIPAFIYIYAWIAAILLIIGGLVSLMTGG